MSKKKATKHKATVERTTLLFFFSKTEKRQRSQSLRKQWDVHTRGERARETARETTREERRPSGYQSHPDINPRDRQRPVTSRARLPTPSGYKSEGSCVRTASGYQLCSVSELFGCHRGEEERPVTGYQSERSRETERRRTGRRAGASVVFFVELQTLVTGGWFCTGFLGERSFFCFRQVHASGQQLDQFLCSSGGRLTCQLWTPLRLQAMMLCTQGNFVSALDFYQRAIAAADPSLEDELATLHSNCSFTHLKLGQPQEALFHATQAISFKSNWSKGHFRLGEAQFALHDYPSAEKAYAKALEVSPEDATIKKRLTLTHEAISGFYFRQLLAGRDFCINPTNVIERQIFSSAQQMQNFVYLVGDAKTREAVVVDAAWDVKGIRAVLAADNMNLVGAVVTHYHFDHTGGTPPPPFDQLGIKVPGIRELAMEDKVPVYINKHDAQMVKKQNGVSLECMTLLEDSSVISIGSVKLHFIHTPGHTPGSQCIHIQGTEDILMSGDTLFIGSCGRLDLPDCDAQAMYTSLQKKLASLPSNTRVYPGHDYGGPFTTIAQERKQGLLKPMAEKEWLHRYRV